MNGYSRRLLLPMGIRLGNEDDASTWPTMNEATVVISRMTTRPPRPPSDVVRMSRRPPGRPPSQTTSTGRLHQLRARSPLSRIVETPRPPTGVDRTSRRPRADVTGHVSRRRIFPYGRGVRRVRATRRRVSGGRAVAAAADGRRVQAATGARAGRPRRSGRCLRAGRWPDGFVPRRAARSLARTAHITRNKPSRFLGPSRRRLCPAKRQNGMSFVRAR